jgi:hypothetical protein
VPARTPNSLAKSYAAVIDDSVKTWLDKQSTDPKWARLGGGPSGNLWTLMTWKRPVLVKEPGGSKWSFVACILKKAPNGDIYVKYYEASVREAKEDWARLAQQHAQRGASTRRNAIITKCREQDCPSKPAGEKKWCLLTHDRSKALRCAPTKKEVEEHEKAVQYFKHAAIITRAMALPSRRARALWLRQAIAAGYRPDRIIYRGKLWILN